MEYQGSTLELTATGAFTDIDGRLSSVSKFEVKLDMKNSRSSDESWTIADAGSFIRKGLSGEARWNDILRMISRADGTLSGGTFSTELRRYRVRLAIRVRNFSTIL